MAAAKPDLKAAKEAKQKKILIALSVVFVGLMAWQVPKLLGGNESTPAAAPAPVVGDPAAATTPTTGSTASVAPADLAAAAAGARPKAGTSQLASFSLFESKDPFVQKIVEKSETTKATGVAPAKGTEAGGGGGIAVGGGEKPVAVVYAFATVSVNGESEAVQLKKEFPAIDPMFVVAAIGKNQLKVGIAGGKLTNGKLATIKVGKPLTLVNDATGARYVIELLYTGVEPEAIADFSTASTDGAPAATTTTP
jgi:hypothetical protein